MAETSIVSIACALITLAGVIISNMFSNSKTLYRIEQLEKKQDKHNSIIERTYALEESIKLLDERQKVANHRIDDLESSINHKGK